MVHLEAKFIFSVLVPTLICARHGDTIWKLSQGQREARFKMHPKCKNPIIPHLCFADDVPIFCRGKESSIKAIIDIITDFSKSTGPCPYNCRTSILMGEVLSLSKKVLPYLSAFIQPLTDQLLGPPSSHWQNMDRGLHTSY